MTLRIFLASSFFSSFLTFFHFRWLKRLLFEKSNIRFEGTYLSYHEALSLCSGYSDEAILEKVLASTMLVTSGQCVAERDGVTLGSSFYSPAVLAGLFIACSRCPDSISVLDFGGALGSTYFQHSCITRHLNNLRWNVIEQPHYVSAARNHIFESNLFFFSTIEECLASSAVNVCLLSGVLQYLPDPFEVLNNILAIQADVLILDRTPYLCAGACGYYAIQHVPPGIYSASYPSRFFVERELLPPIASAGYSKVCVFPAIDDLAPYAKWLGHVFVRTVKSSNAPLAST